MSTLLVPLLTFAVLYHVSDDTVKVIKIIAILANSLLVYYYLHLTIILVRNLYNDKNPTDPKAPQDVQDPEKKEQVQLPSSAGKKESQGRYFKLPIFLPSSLKKRIIYLHNIDNLLLSKMFIELYLTSAKYMFFLLLILISAILFADMYSASAYN